MNERVHSHDGLIFSPGTQVVVLRAVIGRGARVLHPRGAVGVVVTSPRDLEHSYRIRFADGVEESFARADVVQLAQYKEGDIGDAEITLHRSNLFQRVIFRCVIGSRAYGLEDEGSDTDYRGIFLPSADVHWSLFGVPGQIDCHETQEQYWELQRFLVLALKANPNVLECLYTPLVEHATPLAQELLAMREVFLSRLLYQTYNGYVMSQFKKMQADLRNLGEVKWKHVMHLLRLLLSGINALRNRVITVQVGEHRDRLLAVKRGEIPWSESERWRLSLHGEFDKALAATTLPERPDYERVNAFLIRARHLAIGEALP